MAGNMRAKVAQNMGTMKKILETMPVKVAEETAALSAPALTQASRNSYDSNLDAYDRPRRKGVDGQTLDLYRTGAAREYMRFSATGTRCAVKLGPKYMKYLIGKYEILPINNVYLPQKWRDHLGDNFERAMSAYVKKTGGASK